MDAEVAKALASERIIVDITTTGRKSGQARRIEITLVPLSDGYALSGVPGIKRGWYANLQANPEFIIHLKQGVQADLRAKATHITDPQQRRALITEMAQRDPQRRRINIDAWVAGSPLMYVELLDA